MESTEALRTESCKEKMFDLGRILVVKATFSVPGSFHSK